MPDGVPIEALLMVIFAPSCIALLLGLLSFRREPPLVFLCTSCTHMFRRAAHKRFPRACPRCHARDWACPAGSIPRVARRA